MKTSKWLAAVGVLTLTATMAIAAPHEGMGGGHHGKGMFSEKFAQKLNLTDAQKTQVRDLTKSFREQNKAFFETFRSTMKDYRSAKKSNDTAKVNALQAQFDSQKAQMKQLRAGLDQQISNVLTPDQRAQWEQIKAERAAKHQEWKNKQ
ncbi:MAG: Spy/CpxP family protein refolding chaperone [Thermoanaerobaculia bacterium]